MPTLLLTIPGSPAPGANLLQLPTPSVPQASDGFSVDRSDINGAPTDSGLGGAPLTWQANAGAFRSEGGYLRQNNANSSPVMGAGLNVGNGNIRGTFGLMSLGVQNFNFDFRKSAIDNGAAASPCYPLRVTTAGLVELLRKQQPTANYVVVSVGSHVMAAPGAVGLEIVGRAFRIQIDGQTVETWNEPQTVLSGNFFELVVSAGFSAYIDYERFDTPIT